MCSLDLVTSQANDSGGLSFNSSREGFICDNVVNYRVVLASGEVVDANAEQNPDLWVALRGAGNNLGVVVRFDFRTFAQGPFWGGSIFYTVDGFHGQIEALVEELSQPEPDPDTHLMISVGWATQFASLGGNLCQNQVYLMRDEEKPAVLEPFTSIPQLPMASLRRIESLRAAADEQAADSRDDVR